MKAAQIVYGLLEDNEDFDLVDAIDELPDAVPIHREAELTPGQRKYWRKFADGWVGRLYGLIDPWRTSVTELRKLYPAGTRVYQAATGGKYGKSSRRVTL